MVELNQRNIERIQTLNAQYFDVAQRVKDLRHAALKVGGPAHTSISAACNFFLDGPAGQSTVRSALESQLKDQLLGAFNSGLLVFAPLPAVLPEEVESNG